ncbi:transcription termination factor NusA [Mycoplasma putrefaciens]|uniref:transcription termination factor NusA n=1 Tax=Mycoplasma putrefaciens TaxID=2123 RepID=UPI003DA46D44
MLKGSELLKAIKLIEDEKKIDREIIISGIKEGLQKAYEKFFDTDAVVQVEIDQQTGQITMNQQLKVVEEVEDDWLEISLADAKIKNPDIKIGDVIFKPIEFSEEFSRMVVNQVRQIFQQKIRGAEREKIYEKFIGLEGEIVQAKVTGMNKEGNYVLDIDSTTAYLWKSKAINNETFEINQIIDVYIESVAKESRYSQLSISRTSPDFLAKLIEREVPEVRMGLIEIKAVSREPGKRAKVAVVSKDENIEPIGSIVGVAGSRINKISQQLKGEKIDIVKWEPDQQTFIINAMSPVKVISINSIDEEYDIVVPDRQLSLAIGKEGIAAKLVANLIKSKINIYSLSNALNENIDVLWNGNITQFEVEDDNFEFVSKIQPNKIQSNKVFNIKPTNIIKHQKNKKPNTEIDTEALAAFQAEVAQQEFEKQVSVQQVSSEQAEQLVKPVEVETKSLEITESKPHKANKKAKEVEILEQEPNIDEINANLEAFNQALNQFEDQEVEDEDETIEDYDKYYE